jgi:F-box-like
MRNHLTPVSGFSSRPRSYWTLMVPPPMQSFGYESTAQRVLAIPELLQTIFSFGTRASNASNALVCRNWCEAALDHVWREIDDMYHLLHLLTPLYRRGETILYVCQFECILEPSRDLLTVFDRRFATLQHQMTGHASFLMLVAFVLSNSGPIHQRRHFASPTVSFTISHARAPPLRFSQICGVCGGILPI